MSETVTNLREGNATAYVEGILSGKNLEVVTEDGARTIKGSLEIQTAENDFVTFQVYCSEFKKGTKEKNSVFAGIETIMNQYKSIADVGKEEADRVRVTKGQISPRSFVNKGGQVQESVNYRANFFNRLKDSEELDPKAEFELEVYIQSIVPEMGKNEDGEVEETGNVLVNAWLPTYNNGIEKIILTAPQEDGIADAIQSEYEPGQTVEFYGTITNQRIVTEETIPVKIGKPKVKTHVTYKNALIINGASEAYEEGVYKVPYTKEAIDKAITDREMRLEEEKSKASNNSAQKSGTKAKPVAGRKVTF